MQMAELNHNASLDLSVQKRFVSNATIKNIRDIFEYTGGMNGTKRSQRNTFMEKIGLIGYIIM